MSDRILGAACVAASAAMAWAARDYAAAISYEPVGPRAFPLLLAALLAVGGLWLVAKPALRGAAAYRHVPLRATALAAAAVVAYALLFETLGFTLATALMAVPLGLVFGGTLRATLAGGVALGVVLYFLFDKALDVVLPTGVLAFLLGGR
ncbi:MAG: tripartite tricarboxylate transporter TctB family protein [Ideonella sp.]|nr:tripartite tricarboxylate transporter TctB family protein [Ideonella sp.]MCC7455409.1 tripartite tricarboxylate transporter TctB family protein [Nitrospira sp.]